MNHHGGIADEGFLHPPANGKDTLRHKDLALDDQDHPVVSPPPTSVVSNNSTPPQLQKVSGQQSSETVERKQGVYFVVVIYRRRCTVYLLSCKTCVYVFVSVFTCWEYSVTCLTMKYNRFLHVFRNTLNQIDKGACNSVHYQYNGRNSNTCPVLLCISLVTVYGKTSRGKHSRFSRLCCQPRMFSPRTFYVQKPKNYA